MKIKTIIVCGKTRKNRVKHIYFSCSSDSCCGFAVEITEDVFNKFLILLIASVDWFTIKLFFLCVFSFFEKYSIWLSYLRYLDLCHLVSYFPSVTCSSTTITKITVVCLGVLYCLVEFVFRSTKS